MNAQKVSDSYIEKFNSIMQKDLQARTEQRRKNEESLRQIESNFARRHREGLDIYDYTNGINRFVDGVDVPFEANEEQFVQQAKLNATMKAAKEKQRSDEERAKRLELLAKKLEKKMALKDFSTKAHSWLKSAWFEVTHIHKTIAIGVPLLKAKITNKSVEMSQTFWDVYRDRKKTEMEEFSTAKLQEREEYLHALERRLKEDDEKAQEIEREKIAAKAQKTRDKLRKKNEKKYEKYRKENYADGKIKPSKFTKPLTFAQKWSNKFDNEVQKHRMSIDAKCKNLVADNLNAFLKVRKEENNEEEPEVRHMNRDDYAMQEQEAANQHEEDVDLEVDQEESVTLSDTNKVLFTVCKHPELASEDELKSFEKLGDQLLKNHMVDWLMGNSDVSVENFAVTTDSDTHEDVLQSASKTEAFKNLDGVNSLEMSTKQAKTAKDSPYNVAFNLFAQGKIDLNLESIYNQVQSVVLCDEQTYLNMMQPYIYTEVDYPAIEMIEKWQSVLSNSTIASERKEASTKLESIAFEKDKKREKITKFLLQRKNDLKAQYSRFFTKLVRERWQNADEAERTRLQTVFCDGNQDMIFRFKLTDAESHVLHRPEEPEQPGEEQVQAVAQQVEAGAQEVHAGQGDQGDQGDQDDQGDQEVQVAQQVHEAQVNQGAQDGQGNQDDQGEEEAEQHVGNVAEQRQASVEGRANPGVQGNPENPGDHAE